MTRQVLALDGDTGAGRELLGGKAASIEAMRAMGIPVPPAFVLTTAVCRRFDDPEDGAGAVPADVWAQLPGAMAELEWATGRTFGAGVSPLLVSVRSGAALSMPGMMDTVLNLGMTNAVRHALAAESGDERYIAAFQPGMRAGRDYGDRTAVGHGRRHGIGAALCRAVL